MQTMFYVIPYSPHGKYWYFSFADEQIEPQSDYVTWLNSDNLQMAELELNPESLTSVSNFWQVHGTASP